MIFAQSYKNLSYLQKKKENFSSFIKEKQYLCILIIKKYDMPQSLHIAIIGGVPQNSLRRSARHRCHHRRLQSAGSLDHRICGRPAYWRIAYSSLETKSFTMRVYAS